MTSILYIYHTSIHGYDDDDIYTYIHIRYIYVLHKKTTCEQLLNTSMAFFNKHKDIGILYLIFALFSGLIGTFLSLLIGFN